MSSNLTLIPIERELQERLSWFIRLRWIAGAVVILGGWVASQLVPAGRAVFPLYGLGIFILAYNLFFYHFLTGIEREPNAAKLYIYVQIALDWLALTLVLHYTGGIRSPAVVGFGLHLIIAAILLSRTACYVLVVLISVLLAALSISEAFLLWPRPELSRLLLESSHGVLNPLNLWISLATYFAVVAFLATSITRQLRRRERDLSESEQRLDLAYREMEELYQLGQVVNSTLNMGEVLSLIAEHATRLMGMKACFIRLFDRTGQRLFVGGSYGLSQAYIDKGPVEVKKSLIDSETLAGGVVQVLDVGSDPRFQYREEARREGLQSVLCVPVAAKSRVLGVIRVYSAAPHRFSEQEENFLKNLANLGAMAIENARAYAELKNLNEQKVWFARMTHHQLRSPLSAIRSVLDALPFAGKLTGKQQDLITRGGRRVQDAFEMIRDLLDLAASQRPIDDAHREKVDLSSLLRKLIESVQERAREKSLQLDLNLPEDKLVIESNSEDMERIVANLLDNAVKYTPAGGSVTLSSGQVDGRVYIAVADSGIGIEEADQQRVFEGFYRSQSAKATGEIGTGLGLSIVKQLVERWEGQLQLESEPGKGTTFTILLPSVTPQT